MTITAKDKAFEKRIHKRVLAGRKVARKDLLRAMDIAFALRRQAAADTPDRRKRA